MNSTDLDSYKQQLIQVDHALTICCEDTAREELLILKNTIEELLPLIEDCNNEPSPSKLSSPDEYALFMAEMQKAGAIDESNEEDNTSQSKTLVDIEGKKCRAPHKHHWGNVVYHNAMICSLETDNSDDEAKVRVLYTHPTHQEMKPCPYYYDSDCKFSDDKCRFSHGEIVPYYSLQEYVEPNFENLSSGSIVLAKQSDDLWYRAVIKEIYDNKCTITFEIDKKQMEVNFEDIFPLNDEKEAETSDMSEVEEGIAYNDKDNMDVINRSLMVTTSNVPMGDWEKYTKGLGSKLMAKMGYIIGTGLGKRSDGRIDPVSAVILPAGKSLDHCMKLREESGGDGNFFKADRMLRRRLQRKQNKQDKKPNEKKTRESNIFNFINRTLENGKEIDFTNKRVEERQVRQECSRNLNIKSLQLAETIKQLERDIFVLKESLSRNSDPTSSVHNTLKDKLEQNRQQLSLYQSQAELIKNEQSYRNDKKKMTVF